MRKIGFVVDSTFGDKFSDISFVPLTIELDGEEYLDTEVGPDVVINALKDKKQFKTSQPTPGAFALAYKEQFDLGYDHVITLTLASSLSGTYNSANLAKDIVDSERITVIDTETANVGSMYILDKALAFANEGNSLEDTIALIESLVKEGSIIFSVDDLGSLVRSGRLGRTAALIGNILRIKPILRFRTGKLEVEARARRFSGVLKYITNQVQEMVSKLKVIVRITYVDNLSYAKQLEESILALNIENIDVKITGILPAIISGHVGLGGMGIYLTSE